MRHPESGGYFVRFFVNVCSSEAHFSDLHSMIVKVYKHIHSCLCFICLSANFLIMCIGVWAGGCSPTELDKHFFQAIAQFSGISQHPKMKNTLCSNKHLKHVATLPCEILVYKNFLKHCVSKNTHFYFTVFQQIIGRYLTNVSAFFSNTSL